MKLDTFKTKAGISADHVIRTAEDVNAFLKQQEGFISSHLGLSDDGTWHDILFWESQEHVMNEMEKVAQSSHCAAFFGVIDEASDKMALFQSLMSTTK